MGNAKHKQLCEIGMAGLGVMGRNLVLNMADHGFPMAGYDKDQAQVETLQREAGERAVQGTSNVLDFISLLRKPRAIMLLVPAGDPVDAVIEVLLPHLEKGDLIIDPGNSYSKDTNLGDRGRCLVLLPGQEVDQRIRGSLGGLNTLVFAGASEKTRL